MRIQCTLPIYCLFAINLYIIFHKTTIHPLSFVCHHTFTLARFYARLPLPLPAALGFDGSVIMARHHHDADRRHDADARHGRRRHTNTNITNTNIVTLKVRSNIDYWHTWIHIWFAALATVHLVVVDNVLHIFEDVVVDINVVDVKIVTIIVVVINHADNLINITHIVVVIVVVIAANIMRRHRNSLVAAFLMKVNLVTRSRFQSIVVKHMIVVIRLLQNRTVLDPAAVAVVVGGVVEGTAVAN